MSLYDPTLTREFNPMYRYHCRSPIPNYAEDPDFQFRTKRSDGWELVGEEYSLWSDPPIEAKWVRAIQAFEPNLVPVWIRLAFRAPNSGIHVYVRHGLARICTANRLKYDWEMKPLLMPTSPLPWRVAGKPHHMAAVFRDPQAPDIHPGLPIKPYFAFSKSVVDEIKAQFDAYRDEDKAEADVEQWARDSADTDRTKLEKVQAEADYRWDQQPDMYAALRDMPSRELDEAVAMTYSQPAPKAIVH